MKITFEISLKASHMSYDSPAILVMLPKDFGHIHDEMICKNTRRFPVQITFHVSRKKNENCDDDDGDDWK
jgi:hypothetical protein